MKTPCENCPYRKDAPRKLWDREEFERLLETEADQIVATYACHKQGGLPDAERGFCAGWLLDQRARGLPSIALRMKVLTDGEAAAALEVVSDGGHALYPSVEAMCRANGVSAKRGRAARTTPPRT
jgi:hypothetical protein